MSHWYAWFPGDYLRDTQHLSMIEDAAYRRLLDAYYMAGKLSANAEVLLRVCRAVTPEEQTAVRKVAGEFFECHGEQLFHAKVEHCIAESRTISAKRSEAGKKGAAKTNALKAAIAASDVAANAAASASSNAPSIPQPHVNLPKTTSSGAVAPPVDPDPIFGGCLAFLKAKGCAEKGARSFLALMRKDHGEAAVVQAIERAEREDVSEPIPWLRNYLAGSTKPSGRRGPIPENFAARDYGQGGRL